MTKEVARRCHKAPKKLKGVMLDELCALTGWSRDHARRALRAALEARAPRRRPRREPTYGTEIMEPLRKIWATLDGLCGKLPGPVQGGDRGGDGAPRGARAEPGLEDLDVSGRYWCRPEIHLREGEALFAATKTMALEGIIAKRLDSC